MTVYYDASAWTGRAAHVGLRFFIRPRCVHAFYWRRSFDSSPWEISEHYGLILGRLHWADAWGLLIAWGFKERIVFAVSGRSIVEHGFWRALWREVRRRQQQKQSQQEKANESA